MPVAVDTSETSGFGDADKTYVVGLRGHTFKIAGQWDGASNGPDEVLSNLAGAGAAGTVITQFVWGPAGSATGNVKYAGSCWVTSFQPASPIGGAVTFSADGIVNGAVARSTF